MLVLTRKLEEEIIIGEKNNEVVIKILKIQGDKVSIGIKASKDTPILRSELIKNTKIEDVVKIS